MDMSSDLVAPGCSLISGLVRTKKARSLKNFGLVGDHVDAESLLLVRLGLAERSIASRTFDSRVQAGTA
jgi:hypothetical protein